MKIAAIDVGSNSIHMVLIEVDEAGNQVLLAREKAMVGLGRSLGRDGIIQPDAFEAGLEALRRMQRLLTEQGCGTMVAFGTATLRDALNAGNFIAEAAASGVPIRVISGEEEARLIYQAVSHAVPFPDDPVVLVDIGGGSTEITWHAGGGLKASTSIPWGTQRLADAVPCSNPPSPENHRALRRLIRKELKKAGKELPKNLPEPFLILGTSGTLESLARGASGDTAFTVEQLEVFEKKLWRESASGRIDRLGVEPKRGDNLHVGATWTMELLRWLGPAPVRHLPVGLREGMIWEVLRHDGADVPPLADLRRSTVEALAVRSDRDPQHSLQVQRLAGDLFASLRHAFDLGDQEGEWLAHAARLHDIGFSISEKAHHKHGAYIVSNSRLQGFWTEEVEILALLVRHHRGAMPHPEKHEGFGRLDPWHRRAVEKLTGILRLADALDRRRIQAVRSLQLELNDRHLVLHVEGHDDLLEERAAVAKKGALLERLLDRSVVWRQEPRA